MRAVGEGEIRPGEAQTVASILEVQRKTIEVADLEHRILELEKEHPNATAEGYLSWAIPLTLC